MDTSAQYRRLLLLAGWGLITLVKPCATAAQDVAPANAALVRPTGVAVDAQTGSIYFSERDAHRVRRLTSLGSLEAVAGTGVQGFSGDGAAASLANLDSPEGLAVSAAGDVYIADTGNHRVRLVSAASGKITTIAGTGEAGFSGDGGLAVQARITDPRALAIDPAGNLAIVDRANQRIRTVNLQTGVISTLVGNGRQGLANEGVPGPTASLNDPAAVTFDGSGALYIADEGNHRICVLDPVTHLLTTLTATGWGWVPAPSALVIDTDGSLLVVDRRREVIVRIDRFTRAVSVVAGTGAEAFAGDGSDATRASLDTPRALAISADGSLLLADSGNDRLRRVEPGNPVRPIETIAGVGAGVLPTLRLTGPSRVVYGSGDVQIALGSGDTAGLVTLQDVSVNPPAIVGQIALAQGAGTISLGALNAGAHRLTANHAGVSTSSAVLSLTVDPLPVTAVANSTAMLYGQTPPALSGSLSGTLTRDAGSVSAVFHADVSSASSPGRYPIGAALVGTAATNYSVLLVSSQVTVSKAPTTVLLSSTASVPAIITARIRSSTTGNPSGTATVVDGGVPIATLALGNDGTSTWSASQLPAGLHQLQAVYSGDRNFLGGTSSILGVEIDGAPAGSPTQADFMLAAAGPGSSSLSMHAGDSATLSLLLTPVHGHLAGPVMLSVSGLPTFATGSFDPPVIPPADGSSAFTLQITTSPLAGNEHVGRSILPLLCMLLVPLGYRSPRRRSQSLMGISVCLLLLLPLGGCGDRMQSSSASGSNPSVVTYTVVVTGTATGIDGKLLQHSLSVPVQVTK